MTSLDGTVWGGPWDSGLWVRGLDGGWGLAAAACGTSGPVSREPSPTAGFLPRVCPHFRPGVGGGLLEFPPFPPFPPSGASCLRGLLPTRWDEESHLSPVREVQVAAPAHGRARETRRRRPERCAELPSSSGLCGPAQINVSDPRAPPRERVPQWPLEDALGTHGPEPRLRGALSACSPSGPLSPTSNLHLAPTSLQPPDAIRCPLEE
ncbi:uncharacterized protein LOC107196057 isoform X3 [Pteropus alecto]|uniref:uncharacterized protein LOC107196057 isoform X3 n=1 Tax=Pteropus alecto TaxID=9402 RepID=UPI000D5341BF|nr:uncharacterized protein LOC107196057 isoform X3 [Pteropus alecto]